MQQIHIGKVLTVWGRALPKQMASSCSPFYAAISRNGKLIPRGPGFADRLLLDRPLDAEEAMT